MQRKKNARTSSVPHLPHYQLHFKLSMTTIQIGEESERGSSALEVFTAECCLMRIFFSPCSEILVSSATKDWPQKAL